MTRAFWSCWRGHNFNWYLAVSLQFKTRKKKKKSQQDVFSMRAMIRHHHISLDWTVRVAPRGDLLMAQHFQQDKHAGHHMSHLLLTAQPVSSLTRTHAMSAVVDGDGR